MTSRLEAKPFAPILATPLHVGAPNMGPWHEFSELAQEIFRRRWLTNRGPLVIELEQKLQAYLQVDHVVLCANGTLALELAAQAAGLSGEVIVPSFTFIASAHALQWQGLKPVFCDIDPLTYNIDPEAIEALITPATRAILGVHLYGRPCEIERLQQIADRHGLSLLFDAAHAFGCRHQGKPIGGNGLCEVFSFHATKVFNTFEGGAVATNDAALADKVRLLQNFGFQAEDHVIALGINGKMPEINAAMGLVNLEHLDSFVAVNRGHYGVYARQLKPLPGIRLIDYSASNANNYHYIIIDVDATEFGASRDQLRDYLRQHNVLARRYFTPGCHRMAPYQGVESWHLPHTEAVCERLLALPNGTQLSAAMVQHICDLIRHCPRQQSGAKELLEVGR
jgi:dTDP-4-amino-4,6-dideoxygalactose transaminase